MTKQNFVEVAKDVAKVLKMLGHPDRLLVLCYLSEGELSAGELVDRSTLSFSAFSQHLAMMRKSGLIQTRREGQNIYYSIKDPSILKILKALKETYCNNLY